MALAFFASTARCLVRRGSSGARCCRFEQLERRQLFAMPQVIFKADFEAVNDFSRWWTKDINNTGAITTTVSTSEPSRSGSRSAKFTLPAYNQRSELALTPDPAGADRWYALSVFIPKDWVPDPLRVIVAQWHEQPDFDLGETWRVPPLYLSVLGSRWNAESRFDIRPVSTDSLNARPPYGGTTKYDLGAVQTGVWTDWVLHVKWSFKGDGLLNIWRNGTQVVDQAGPNTYNDEAGNYFKTGIYQPDYLLATRPVMAVKTLYIDEVREATGTATYADVAPGRRSSRRPGHWPFKVAPGMTRSA